VPGWGGIASTKWLVGLELVAERFQGYWNARKYVLVTASGDEVGRVEQMPVKSLIIDPAEGSILSAGPVTVHGFAWSGRGSIVQVEVSVDAGVRWQPAMIIGQPDRRAWAPWTYEWSAEPGSYRLAARATDSQGGVQPIDAPWNAQGYQMNGVKMIDIHIRH
jgi:DMSO/TMAO reductase YedYZ molybdopterin-dependent catalytic subunit